MKEQKRLNSGRINLFEIILAVKDGKDIVRIGDVRPANSGVNLFYFESNLSYSFESIISELEIMTNMKFIDDFLEDTKYVDGKQIKGIILDFNLNEDGIYIPYYKVIIDKVYVLSK